MTNPTTPFSWQMPTASDLVTDLPADFETFGQAVATSMADLLGGTTGQILSKASNTDMDFTWITNDVGDITAVTASAPLTGGGTSGAITVGIQDALTTQKGAVQLSDSTSSTSTTLAATANAVKTSYDLAAAAIPKSTVTTAGDVIYATGSSTVTRLGIGTTGQVLTVASGVPSWATPSAGGSTFSGASIFRSTDLTLSASASTTFTWDSESFDTDGYHSTSTNTDRFTIPAGKSGKFLLMCNAFVGTQSASLEGYYMKNGTDIRRFDLTTSPTKTMVAHTVLDLVATDYVIFRIYNASGSSANCATGGGNLTQWSITYLGA